MEALTEERQQVVDCTGAFLCAGRDEMGAAEEYEFDRLGYLVLRAFLTQDEVAALSAATDALETHANANLPTGTGGEPLPPHKRSPWGGTYHFNPELGYHCNHVGEVDGNGANGGSSTIIEDFFNADDRFDMLVDHPKTMNYIRNIVQDRPTINNSEIRLRYSGNRTPSHQPGSQREGPPKGKYQYQYSNGGIDCKMVRMIYFIHDVSNEDGAFCVTPGSHKSNRLPPAEFAPSQSPADDPTMVGLEVKAGDCILFTEATRHGGFPNRSGVPRKTLHVGYGPYWLASQNIATMDEPPFLLERTYQRYSPTQRALFNAWPREAREGLSLYSNPRAARL